MLRGGATNLSRCHQSRPWIAGSDELTASGTDLHLQTLALPGKRALAQRAGIVIELVRRLRAESIADVIVDPTGHSC